jgi:hypothetical protein
MNWRLLWRSLYARPVWRPEDAQHALRMREFYTDPGPDEIAPEVGAWIGATAIWLPRWRRTGRGA